MGHRWRGRLTPGRCPSGRRSGFACARHRLCRSKGKPVYILAAAQAFASRRGVASAQPRLRLGEGRGVACVRVVVTQATLGDAGGGRGRSYLVLLTRLEPRNRFTRRGGSRRERALWFTGVSAAQPTAPEKPRAGNCRGAGWDLFPLPLAADIQVLSRPYRNPQQVS